MRSEINTWQHATYAVNYYRNRTAIVAPVILPLYYISETMITDSKYCTAHFYQYKHIKIFL